MPDIGERPDRDGRHAGVDNGHDPVCPSPSYRVGEDAAEHQSQGVTQGLGHAIHREAGVPPLALGKGICDQGHGGRQAHGHGDTETGSEHYDLDACSGEAESHGEDDEEDAAGDPGGFGPEDVGYAAKHMEQATCCEGVDSCWPLGDCLFSSVTMSNVACTSFAGWRYLLQSKRR